MYSLISALTLENTTDAQYAVTDVSQTPINLLYSLYSEIYLTLSNPYLPANVYVNMDDVRVQLAGYSGLISQWLGNIGNMTLPTIDALPTTGVLYARYSDATRAAYKFDVWKVGFQIPLNYPVDLLPDLKVSRPGYSTDVTLIDQYCLTTVNGFLHATDSDGTYSYILNGAQTMRRANNNNVGILSFLDIGKVQTYPVDTAQVYADASNSGSTLSNKMYLYLNQDTTGKTVMLSLGGYLVAPQENLFYQVGNNTFCLHTAALPMLERYYESFPYLDLSSLSLDPYPLSATAISASQFLSDTVLLKYLQLPQSFWIVIDTPTLHFTPQYIEASKLPGSFISGVKPNNPLVVGYGRMAEYWTVYEDGLYSMHVDNSFLLNYTFSTNPAGNTGNVNSATLPWRPYVQSPGYTLLIHT